MCLSQKIISYIKDNAKVTSAEQNRSKTLTLGLIVKPNYFFYYLYEGNSFVSLKHRVGFAFLVPTVVHLERTKT